MADSRKILGCLFLFKNDLLQYLIFLAGCLKLFFVVDAFNGFAGHLLIVIFPLRFHVSNGEFERLIFFAEHFVLLLDLVLIEELAIVFTFDIDKRLLQPIDFIVFFSEQFKVVLLLDEDLIRIVDDLAQFGVFSLELLDGVVLLEDLEVEIDVGLGCRQVLEDRLAMHLQLTLQILDAFLIIQGSLLEFLLQLPDLYAVVLQVLRWLACRN